MAVTQEELLLTRNRLVSEFGDEAVMLASMASFYYKTTLHYGPVANANYTVLIACIKSRAVELGINWQHLMRAIAAHERAAETLGILAKLED